MALELLDGDLGAHMRALGAAGERIALPQALAWLGQINGALAKVHAHGWRYLDLKPGNLLLDRRSATLKLADFGTNRSLLDTAAHSYTGTASWQAPEQFFPQGAGYLTDARTDYFALGAVFYYLVTSGATLRYCGSCAAAWREHGHAAAAHLRERWDGALPAILAEDEAAHFAACAARGGADPAPSLALLRSLLAARREDRPRHALEISRLIAAAAGAAQPWRSVA
ncbi:protein kinase [Massilia sp. Dwa41.01b]|uniref:protein kinase domain-containing protein n=1 Tax=Massilia sp. Dwa41.01b TaxID=2709302 RepID=UPI001E52E2CE|nr:protein kinase [Massilia sp. Dwa41.01b]